MTIRMTRAQRTLLQRVYDNADVLYVGGKEQQSADALIRLGFAEWDKSTVWRRVLKLTEGGARFIAPTQ